MYFICIYTYIYIYIYMYINLYTCIYIFICLCIGEVLRPVPPTLRLVPSNSCSTLSHFGLGISRSVGGTDRNASPIYKYIYIYIRGGPCL